MIHVKHREPDGTTHAIDDADMAEFVVTARQWSRVSMAPAEERRHLLEQAVIANKRDTSGDRSPIDEQTMDFARDAASGEAHEQREEAQ